MIYYHSFAIAETMRSYFTSANLSDKRLMSNVIRTQHKLANEIHCMIVYCDNDPQCTAINYNTALNKCELLSAKYHQAGIDLVDGDSWTYYETAKP